MLVRPPSNVIALLRATTWGTVREKHSHPDKVHFVQSITDQDREKRLKYNIMEYQRPEETPHRLERLRLSEEVNFHM